MIARHSFVGDFRWVGGPAVAILLCASAPGLAVDYTIAPGGKNKVTFISKATMETFEGSTDQIQGRIALDPGAVGDSVFVHVEVDLASLDTGIGKRNSHMREKHLETDEFPTAVFSGATILSGAGTRLVPGEKVTFEIEGVLDLHGVKHRTPATAEVVLENGRLRVEASLRVDLADHNIKRPKFLFLRLGEVQDVIIEVTARQSP